MDFDFYYHNNHSGLYCLRSLTKGKVKIMGIIIYILTYCGGLFTNQVRENKKEISG